MSFCDCPYLNEVMRINERDCDHRFVFGLPARTVLAVWFDPMLLRGQYPWVELVTFRVLP